MRGDTNGVSPPSLNLRIVSGAEVYFPVTISTGLENHDLLIVICLPARSDTHLEVPKDLEPARFKWVDREKRAVNLRAILGSGICIGEPKQISKHFGRLRHASIILAVITILNDHDAQGNGIQRSCTLGRLERHLLQVEAEIEILKLDALANDIIQLRSLLH